MNKKWTWGSKFKIDTVEQENCPCCYKPKDDCTGCAVWSGVPQPIPDVPRWLGAPRAIEEEKTEQGATETAEKEGESDVEPWPCICGAGVPRFAEEFTDALADSRFAFVCVDPKCNAGGYGVDRRNAIQTFNHYWGKEPKEEESKPAYPGAPSEGSDQVSSASIMAAVGGTAEPVCITKTKDATYVNGELIPWPCECGAGVPEVRLTSCKRYQRTSCRSCLHYSERETTKESIAAWNKYFGAQPKGETPTISNVNVVNFRKADHE